MPPAKWGLRALTLVCGIFFALLRGACADEIRDIRIGDMKLGLPLIVKQRHLLEDRFAARGITIKWSEFSVGPALVEALAAGEIDFGGVGNTPPIFAESAGANVAYVASGGPRTAGSVILALKNSALRGVADLTGKRVGICKGSAEENLVIAALEREGLSYRDITPVYLSPSHAATAFISGRIDARPTRDPSYALAQHKLGARVLIDADSVAPTCTIFLANGFFAKTHPELIDELADAFGEAADWANAHKLEVVDLTVAATGLPQEVVRTLVGRAQYVVQPVSEDAIPAQQAVADRFYRLQLIPRPVEARDAVWVAPPVPAQSTPARTAPQGDAPHENR